MSEKKPGVAAKWLTMLMAVGGVLVFFAVPEFFILYQREGREYWPRMIPAIVMGPILWSFAIFSLCAGVCNLYSTIEEKNFVIAPFCLALIYPGIRIPHYWFQRIIVDNVPAFGYNPDNIYAVAGLNSIGLGIWWCIQGLIVGFLLSHIIRGIYYLFKIEMPKN